MLVGNIQNFNNNTINGNKVQNKSKTFLYKQNGLASDTFSFGNSTVISFAMKNIKWIDDSAIMKQELKKKFRADKDILKIGQTKMEEHFHGFLDLIMKRNGQIPETTLLDESLFESRFLYEDCCCSLNDVEGVNKLKHEIAKTDFPFYLSPEFCIAKRDEFGFFNNAIIEKLKSVKNNPNSCVVFRMKNNAKNAVELRIVSDISLLKQEQKQALKTAVQKTSGTDLAVIKEGLEDLVKMNSFGEIKEFMLNISSPKAKKPDNMNLSTMFYDIGTMFLKHNKDDALQGLIKDDKDLPALVKVFLEGSKVGFKK